MGSAKSNCGVMEIINHALNVPNGQTIMLAQTLKQLSKAIMPIFDEYLPRKFVTKWTDTKKGSRKEARKKWSFEGLWFMVNGL